MNTDIKNEMKKRRNRKEKRKQRKGENYDVCEFWRIYKQEES